MPGISIGGFSGLPPNIVDQLVEAEKIPIKNIELQKGKQENRLKLVTDLESKLSALTGSLSSLSGTKGFKDIKLNSGDPNILQGTIDPEVSPKGSWNIEVVRMAQKAAALTNGFPDKDKTEIGVGYFRFNTPEGQKEVYIKGGSSTLEGAANAINNANIGVKAAVLNDRKDPDNPFRLMITGNDVGADNRIDYPTLYFLDGDEDLYFDENREAVNGLIKLDGMEIEISDNKLEDLIAGVTLDIMQSAPGRNVNVSVSENLEVVTGKIKGFVDATNAVLGFIQQQNQMNEKTDTSSTLGGDGLLRSIETRIRRMIQEPQIGVAGPVKRLSELGIQFNRAGLLEYKEEAFNNTLKKNPAAVQQFFAGDGFATGFIPTVRREVTNLLNASFGAVSVRKKALQDRIGRMDDQVANKERMLAVKEESLRRKFSKLEETVSRLKSQGAAVGGFAAQAHPGG